MNISAVVFGSLGTLTETSHLHHRAFNETFEAEGLGWTWDEPTYRELLSHVGGVNRVLEYAESLGETPPMTEDRAREIHARKTARYAEMVERTGLSLRPGVARLIDEARRADIRVGLATGTSIENIEANLAATGDRITLADFDEYTVRDNVPNAKPAPDAHLFCMQRLGVDSEHTVAIEDSADGVNSAASAGAFVVATPGEYVSHHDFGAANLVVTNLGDDGIPSETISGTGPEGSLVTIDWLASLSP